MSATTPPAIKAATMSCDHVFPPGFARLSSGAGGAAGFPSSRAVLPVLIWPMAAAFVSCRLSADTLPGESIRTVERIELPTSGFLFSSRTCTIPPSAATTAPSWGGYAIKGDAAKLATKIHRNARDDIRFMLSTLCTRSSFNRSAAK